MNSHKRLPIAQGAILLILLLGCLSCADRTRTVTMRALQPAVITFPSSVDSLVVVDRTVFDQNNLNILEGILTGELPNEDKAGVQILISSFQNQIQQSPRFNVKIAEERLIGNSMTAAFPDQLSWDQINHLCTKYMADAVVSIEIFDTDFIITNGTRTVKKKKSIDGVMTDIDGTEYYAQGVGNITIGLKLYDPQAQSIIDQEYFQRTKTWTETGINTADALAKLVSKGQATQYLGKLVGENYAKKITPSYYNITRGFRAKSKKCPQLEQGTRYADVAKWEEAANVWKQGLVNAPTKEAGYLAQNIAIANEVLGNMQEAVNWAEKSYVQYGNKDARDYASRLKRRMRDQARVSEQLK